jgi:peptidoglycan DL-endopeptidase CwlO
MSGRYLWVMGSTALIRFVLVAVVATVAAHAAAATPPTLVAKREQARQVLREIAAIDERLSVVTERFDGARVTLEALRRRLAAERVSLARARIANRRAQLQVAQLLVTLYTSGRPTTLDAILGATSISAMLNLADAENAIGREDTLVANTATQAQQRLGERVRSLQSDRAAAALAVLQLGQARTQIEHGLVQRRNLLASVQAQITQIQARERARQERLAAEARARLAAEQAAQARVEKQRLAAATRAAQRAAAANAQAAAASVATTAPTTTTAAANPLPAATTTPTAVPAPGTPATTGVAAPVLLPAGHPLAAQIALGYVGDPYAWGGVSPSGFDCSGLVSYVFAQLAVSLPHYAADQYSYGVSVPPDQLQPGDLVFFDNLNHVGIYIGANQFVDAPHTGTFVRIGNLNDPWYATRYVGARRV